MQQHKHTALLSCSLLFAVLLLALGCAKQGLEGTIPIRGTVTYRGSPLTTGEVRYIPESDDGRIARGKLREDGSFQLTTLSNGDGALPGEYKVLVVVYPEQFETVDEKIAAREGKSPKRSAEKPPIPEKYYDVEATDLADTVSSGHSGIVAFELKD